jgi:hypothetical protein
MHLGHSIEPLETRIALASAINATTATFTDVDGDLVTIKFSKPIAQQVIYGSNIFVGTSIPGAEQLLRIDLFNVTPAAAAGVNITFTAVPRDVTGDGIKDGDGKVNVGEIRAFGKALGTVTLPGDLGQINSGTAIGAGTPGTAISSLRVHSLGEFALETGATSIVSRFSGTVGSIVTTGNVRGTIALFSTGPAGENYPLGSLTIGGSLIGGYDAASGTVTALSIGSVKIRGDILGGSSNNTGQISVGQKIGSIAIGGSLVGAGGSDSGSITGSELGNVSIGGDVRGSFSGFLSAGKIGNVTIGGSLIGERESAGLIKASGDMGAVKIGRDVQGGLGLNGSGVGSGRIEAGGKITSVTIGGSLLGFAGYKSGSIFSAGNLGPVTIGGNVVGHDGEFSGSIRSDTRIDSVRIGGSVLGNSGDVSGSLYSEVGGIGAVTIGRDLIGGYGELSGAIAATGTALPSITIGGSVIGGFDSDPFDATLEGISSGYISASTIGTLSIAGDLIGHGFLSGRVSADTIAKMKIGGSIHGGEVIESGAVEVAGRIGSLSIGGDVVSGYQDFTGRIYGGAIDSLIIGGSLRGDFHGTVENAGMIETDDTIGTLSIGGDVVGGGDRSGSILGSSGIRTLTIGGSLIGGYGNDSGVVSTVGTLGTARIGGDIRGGDSNGGITNTGAILAQRIASLTVGGSVYSGLRNLTDPITRSGSITANEDIGLLTVRGSLVGNETHPVLISAGGKAPIAPTIAKPEPGIGSITVGGNVDRTFFLVGYNKNGIGVSADASVGAVKVSGDWIGSYLSAGVQPGADLIFGTSDDQALLGGQDFGAGPVRDNLSISRIASIVIGGQIKSGQNDGLPFDGNQTYAFVAQQIGSFKYDEIVVPLRVGASNDTFAMGKARPLGASRSSLNADGFAMHVFEV